MAESLKEAVILGNYDIVDILLDKNNSLVNWGTNYDEYMKYYIEYALEEGHLRIANLFIKYGFDIKTLLAESYSSRVCLDIRLAKNEYTLARWLTDRGVDIDC